MRGQTHRVKQNFSFIQPNYHPAGSKTLDRGHVDNSPIDVNYFGFIAMHCQSNLRCKWKQWAISLQIVKNQSISVDKHLMEVKICISDILWPEKICQFCLFRPVWILFALFGFFALFWYFSALFGFFALFGFCLSCLDFLPCFDGLDLRQSFVHLDKCNSRQLTNTLIAF